MYCSQLSIRKSLLALLDVRVNHVGRLHSTFGLGGRAIESLQSVLIDRFCVIISFDISPGSFHSVHILEVSYGRECHTYADDTQWRLCVSLFRNVSTALFQYTYRSSVSVFK